MWWKAAAMVVVLLAAGLGGGWGLSTLLTYRAYRAHIGLLDEPRGIPLCYVGPQPVGTRARVTIPTAGGGEIRLDIPVTTETKCNDDGTPYREVK